MSGLEGGWLLNLALRRATLWQQPDVRGDSSSLLLSVHICNKQNTVEKRTNRENIEDTDYNKSQQLNSS